MATLFGGSSAQDGVLHGLHHGKRCNPTELARCLGNKACNIRYSWPYLLDSYSAKELANVRSCQFDEIVKKKLDTN
ncbi:hypothetical protein OUZ56_001102 [Daphnia magna]|uniref:Uncharacterized protein n=1 Tax=Daphnia magna TaxID=35525 RepID=A0ABR0A1M9_9CRUS|nr:hypothetical protein OUZ56_001102 [Daphnia magna]